MYEEIKKIGRFVRGLVNPNYRLDCYYKKFSNEWRELHKDTLEGIEVNARIHHRDIYRDIHLRDKFDNKCSLANWVLSFGKV